MYSEFITLITYNFPLEMFMVVGMVRRKDLNQAFRHNRQVAPRAPTNWILLWARRRKTMSLHHVKWMNARLQGLLVFEVSRLSLKLELILSLKGAALIICQTAEVEFRFFRNPFWTVDV